MFINWSPIKIYKYVQLYRVALWKYMLLHRQASYRQRCFSLFRQNLALDVDYKHTKKPVEWSSLVVLPLFETFRLIFSALAMSAVRFLTHIFCCVWYRSETVSEAAGGLEHMRWGMFGRFCACDYQWRKNFRIDGDENCGPKYAFSSPN